MLRNIKNFPRLVTNHKKMTTLCNLKRNLMQRIVCQLTTLDKFILATTCKELYARFKEYPRNQCNMLDAVASMAHFHFAWTMPKFPVESFERVMEAAAYVGNLHVLEKFAPQIKFPTHQHLLEIILSRGHVHMATWLCSHYKRFLILNGYAAELVGSSGNLEMLKMLHRQTRFGVHMMDTITTIAAQRMDTKMLAWALSAGFPFFPRQYMEDAARTGNIARMEWLLANNFCMVTHCGTNIVTLPASAGLLDVAKWAHSRGFPTDVQTLYRCIDIAILNGHVAVAHWLFHVVGRDGSRQPQPGDQWFTPLLVLAVSMQELRMVTWILANVE